MDLLGFCIALLPIVWLVIALAAIKLPGHVACLSGLALGAVLAVSWWGLGLLDCATATLEGLLNALWPICLVVIAALFTYNLTLRTGAMEKIKGMLSGISPDRRVLALLIAWGFGNFMEGIAGFGTAVAIPASMLVALGFEPLPAVVGCLVVNAMPTAFGSVGVPSLTLLSITGLESLPFCNDVAMLEFVLMFVAPFCLVGICCGGAKALRGMLATTAVASTAFIVPWFVVATFVGPELPNTVGAACSMASIVLCARFRQNRPLDPAFALSKPSGQSNGRPWDTLTLGEGLQAWAPFILIFVLLIGTSTLVPVVHDAIAGLKTSVVVYTGANANTLTFSWVNTPGVMILIATFVGGLIQKATPVVMVEEFARTLRMYWRTVVTICSVMALAKIMGYSGMISAIATVLVAAAGPMYPLISPVIGALGGFVTGSGTSTNVLFGDLQVQTARGLGLSESWIAAGNAAGAGIGKMICPQSVAVGVGATGQTGKESVVLRMVFKYFVAFVIVAGVACLAGSFLGL